MTTTSSNGKIRADDMPTTELANADWADELIVQLTSVNAMAKSGNMAAYDFMCAIHVVYRERILEMNQLISTSSIVSGQIAARQ